MCMWCTYYMHCMFALLYFLFTCIKGTGRVTVFGAVSKLLNGGLQRIVQWDQPKAGEWSRKEKSLGTGRGVLSQGKTPPSQVHIQYNMSVQCNTVCTGDTLHIALLHYSTHCIIGTHTLLYHYEDNDLVVYFVCVVHCVGVWSSSLDIGKILTILIEYVIVQCIVIQ